ncbi:SMC5-SMC6 complex localization factor protein 2 isoform X2 [Rattus norvegicus]|uniref:SMC5-SMC6 complex localization factor protein 2 isoform X2 n=1 Tax=Rattus norvegicus TaxID=10116 RepID=UPI0000DA1B73|nr:SMC5-SMC6 complex localization factor protein 2 isoform X2 [Rattus norvegicus]|eukprot:XP_006231613.1 PREDICTED: SMC5-SMC6 complex localization factor protein 2 isoform X2 [Rattus norvegicus]
MTRRCMPARPGFPSSPAPGSSPPRCHLRPGSTTPAAAGKRTESPGDRNQSIIDFFKPASKQDKHMLDSQKSDIKYRGNGLSITGTEQFERKLSSPKKPKPKRMSSEESPILEAFMKGGKEHHKDRGVHESRRPCMSLSTKYLPKGAGIYAPSSYRLPKEIKARKKKHRSPERRKSLFIHESNREKNDRDRGKNSEDSRKQVPATEGDIFKNSSRSVSSRSSLSRHHPGESPLGARFQLSLASYCREREQKKLRKEQMEQRINSENSFSEASNLSLKSSGVGKKCKPRHEHSKHNEAVPGKSNLSNLENGHLSRKRSSSDSWELSGSKQNKFSDKRKRNSVDSDLKSTKEPVIPKAKESFLEKRPDTSHPREKFIRHIALKTPGGVLRLEDIAKEPDDETDRSSADLAPSNSGHHSSKNSDQVHAASTKDTKTQKPHLPLPQEKSTAKRASNLQKSKPAGSVTSKETKLPLLSHVPSAVSSRVPLNAKNCTLPVLKKDKERSSSKERSGHSAESSKHKEHKAKTIKAVSNESSGKSSGGSLHSEYAPPTASPPAALEVVPCVPSPAAPSDKESSGNSNAGSSALKRKFRGDFDSDEESLGYNLESDEEEETLKSLEEIMALNFSQTPTASGKPPAFSKGLRPQSSDYMEYAQSGTYTNTLERLVKEKEDTQRLDELQKQLQEDIRQGRGIKSPIRIGDQDSTDDEDGLSEEHREFLKKFSVTVDAIPDHHPGEEIFNFLNSGKIFNQYTLDLRDSGFIGESAVEKLILKSGKTDQIFLTTQGFLTTAYHYVQCPVPVLKWLFRMMSVHTDCIVSVQILSTLMEITIRNDTFSDSPVWPWIPSLSDIAAVFFNMGVGFGALFPLETLQPDFNEDSLISETQKTLGGKGSEDSSYNPVFSALPETNILNVVKFLGLCTSIHPEGYQDGEIMLLILMLFKMSLEKELKQIPLVDFQSLLINLMKNIRDWNTKVHELCLGINELSSHPHNLLWLVQLVPNWTSRGRQLRQCLSLVIISKLLDEKHEDIPNANNLQIPVLHRYLVQMKPSDLLKKMILKKKAEQPNETIDDSLHLDLEKQAYYLTYILLHLIGEVSCSHSFSSGQRKHFVLLCGALEKHVKCDIREDARLFYRTKVKDLVARIHGKWQEIIQNCRPTQGQLHDFWVPDS